MRLATLAGQQAPQLEGAAVRNPTRHTYRSALIADDAIANEVIFERRRIVAMDMAFVAALAHEIKVTRTERIQAVLGRISPIERYKIRGVWSVPAPVDPKPKQQPVVRDPWF
jgi:hypothetical protein